MYRGNKFEFVELSAGHTLDAKDACEREKRARAQRQARNKTQPPAADKRHKRRTSIPPDRNTPYVCKTHPRKAQKSDVSTLAEP